MALTKDRNTLRREGDFVVLPVAAGVRIHLGALVAVDADGNAVPAANTEGLRAVGRADEAVDNRDGAAGSAKVQVRRGVFLWWNDSALPVTPGMVYQECFIRDDETVRARDEDAGAANPIAGRVIEVADDGVWVETR
ncbi:MAG: hypothetical protein ACOX44_07870 [Limnochordia bacterium]|jgi:hypothetical protein